MAGAFNGDNYLQSGDWKVAIDPASSLYEKLGLRLDDCPTEQQIREAFFERQRWWKEKDQIFQRNSANPLVTDVGPHTQIAIKNLIEAQKILLDRQTRAQYDKKIREEHTRKAEEEFIKYIHFVLDDNQISQEEKNSLLKKAVTLKLGTSRGEELILAEMKKTGATFKPDSGSGNTTSSSIPFDKLLRKTYYEIFGISKDADYSEIEKVYNAEYKKYLDARDKARATARWVQISEGWEILKDKDKRAAYDEELEKPPKVDDREPVLKVICAKDGYVYKEVRKGEKVTETIVIKNDGGGQLTGKIRSDIEWLVPERKDLTYKHEQTLEIRVLTAKIPVNIYDASGTITIDTNGGPPYSIPFRVILEGLEKSVEGFRKTYVLLIAALFGFIFSFGGSPFLGFLAGALISGVVAYGFAQQFVKIFLNHGTDIFRCPPILIKVTAASVVLSTIMSHLGSGLLTRASSYTQVAVPTYVPVGPTIPARQSDEIKSQSSADEVMAPSSATSSITYAKIGYVNDYAKMISPSVRNELENQLNNFEQKGSTQIVILTVPSLDSETIEEFSYKIVNKWKIDQGKNHSILFLVSKQDRQMRIEVMRGLEKKISLAVVDRIINNTIKPKFAAGDFDGGFLAGASALKAVLASEDDQGR